MARWGWSRVEHVCVLWWVVLDGRVWVEWGDYYVIAM